MISGVGLFIVTRGLGVAVHIFTRAPSTSGKLCRPVAWAPDDVSNRDSGRWPQTRLECVFAL